MTFLACAGGLTGLGFGWLVQLKTETKLLETKNETETAEIWPRDRDQVSKLNTTGHEQLHTEFGA